jgi:glyoxylase I family protein
MKIHHLALKVQDVETCAKFYQDILKLKLIKEQAKEEQLYSKWFDCDGSILMIEREEGLAANNGFVITLEIELKDRPSWIEWLHQSGVEIKHQTEHTLYFQDPEGNRLALSHYTE